MATLLVCVLTTQIGFGRQSTPGQVGSIQGTIMDADFEQPLSGARIEVVETGQRAQSDASGNYSLGDVAPGAYTVIVSRPGYTRDIRTDVVVTAGRLTDVDAELTGEFTDLEEFVVEEVALVGGVSETGLLNLRFEAPSLIDSIGSDLMSRAGASDAGDALKQVAGATVANDNTAVVRGLPDRYVSSQVNGVRLPSANEDKRAVELDQFPSAVIESVQVSKTFTPDQQGDASGGAVNVVLKSVPEDPVFSYSAQTSYNTQVTNAGNFISYDGGGVGAFGKEADERAIQRDNIGQNWDGAVGVSEVDAPYDFKFTTALGGSTELDNGWRVGGFASLFYEKDSSFYDNGVNDRWWQAQPGGPLVPQTQGEANADPPDYTTSLFDVVQGQRTVQWGGMASVGLETDRHDFSVSYLYSHSAQDTATLAEDTRGKELAFPGYDPNDPAGPGNFGDDVNAAPYIRTHTLEYIERTIGTLQFAGNHEFDIDPIELGPFVFDDPKFGWIAASSFSNADQPDKRLFGGVWRARSFNPNAPGGSAIDDPFYNAFRPGANINFGNLQRIYKTIEEDGLQAVANLEFPFEQWSGDEGYLKVGVFEDQVERTFDQENFSNAAGNIQYQAEFDEFWSDAWQDQNRPIAELETDIDYLGEIDISAYYAMLDLPVNDRFKLIGGARVESTDIDVTLTPEEDALWLAPGEIAQSEFEPGDGDVSQSRRNVLPALSAIYDVTDEWSVRAALSKTIARQTFKELTPIIQQEFLGGPIFIGNPDLQIAELDNYDLRVDYRPSDSSLVSLSYFYKDVTNPIEYIQRVVDATFTYPVNYPDGYLSGFELEARQDMGVFWDRLDGVSLGANGTLIDSKVNLPQDEIDQLSASSIDVDLTSRDATGAPEYLFNVYATYDLEDTGTQFGLFYTVQGDTLIAGDSQSDMNYIPAVYRKSFGTLNFSIAQRLGKHFRLRIQAKNLTNPVIEDVFRSDFTGADVTNQSFTRGIDYSVSLGASFNF